MWAISLVAGVFGVAAVRHQVRVPLPVSRRLEPIAQGYRGAFEGKPIVSPWVFAFVGLLPAAVVVWIVATRHRRGSLESASWLVILGAAIFALEHAIFATTCSAQVWCPVPGTFFFGDHVRLHVFMAGVYTVVAAGALIVIARTLLREGRRSGWFTVLAALVVGGTVELVLANVWFAHALAEDVTPGARTFEDFGWMFLYTYLLAWAAALLISYRPVFGGSGST